MTHDMDFWIGVLAGAAGMWVLLLVVGIFVHLVDREPAEQVQARNVEVFDVPDARGGIDA